MECNKWEELGLLYLSEELSLSQSNEYKEHLKNCSFCSLELQQYISDKKNYFNTSLLQETTPEYLDKKIISKCSKKVLPIIPVGFYTFMPFVKKVVISVLFFVLGAGAGAYFAFTYFQTKNSSLYANIQNNNKNSNTVLSNASSFPKLQSINDSLNKSKPIASPKTAEGIIPVDLKK
jgi:hypothetical protein